MDLDDKLIYKIQKRLYQKLITLHKISSTILYSANHIYASSSVPKSNNLDL